MKGRFLLSFCITLFFLICFSPSYAELEISEANVNFGLLTRPKSKTVTIEVVNNSNSPFLGAVNSNSKWISISPMELALSPKQKCEICFTVDSSSLAPGEYKGEVSFAAHIGSESKTITALCTVIEGRNDPYLKVDIDNVDLKEIERGTNPLDKFTVENIGSGTLDISLEFPSWLITEKTLTLSSGQKVPLFFRVLTKDLLPDTYTGDILLKSNGGTIKIPISFKVKPRKDDPIIVTSTSVDLGTVKQGKRARGKFKVSNSGQKSFNAVLTYPDYVIDPVEELLEVTKERNILLVVDTKKLPLGVTSGVIRLTSEYGIADIPFKVNVRK